MVAVVEEKRAKGGREIAVWCRQGRSECRGTGENRNREERSRTMGADEMRRKRGRMGK
jgi:hypothetical protein